MDTAVWILLGLVMWGADPVTGHNARLADRVSSVQDGGANNEFIVVFNPPEVGPRNVGEGEEDLVGMIRQVALGVEVTREINVGRMRAVVVRPTNQEALDALREMPGVRYVESNPLVTIIPVPVYLEKRDRQDMSTFLTPSDITPGEVNHGANYTTPGTVQPDLNQTMCVEEYPGVTFWGLGRVHAAGKPSSYESAPYSQSALDDGHGVDIYVVDTGIYPDHTEFGSRVFWGMTAGSHLAEPETDLNGHGTHVASIAAGATVGVARGPNVYAVKVLGADGLGTGADFLQGLQWILDHVQAQRATGRKKVKAVVNMSLGFNGAYTVIDTSVLELIEADITVVVAAGNEFKNACAASPARVSMAITVGSVKSTDEISSFSNHGACVDILAPGSVIVAAGIDSPVDWSTKHGTSMAAPFVSGVVARYLSSVTGSDVPTPAHVKSYIVGTAGRDFLSIAGGPWPKGTPNRLLHYDCVAQERPLTPPAEVPSTQAPFSKANALMAKYGDMFFVICVLKAFF